MDPIIETHYAYTPNVGLLPHVRFFEISLWQVLLRGRDERAYLRCSEHTTPLLCHSPIVYSATPGQPPLTLLPGKPKGVIEGSRVLCNTPNVLLLIHTGTRYQTFMRIYRRPNRCV